MSESQSANSLIRRTTLTVAVALIALSGATTVSAQLTDQEVNTYLTETLDHALATLDEQTERWKARYVELEGGNIVSELIGYQPPSFIVNIADVSSYLYERTGDSKYAETTRDLLVSMNTYRRFFPDAFRTREEYKDGIPAVNWFRALPVYTTAFLRTQSSGVYSAADVASVRDAVESSAEIVFKFPEWGAMNRAMLRAESLMAAALAFPDHPRARAWRKMAEILASDSIEAWEIEDASSYHPIWLHAYINYLDLTGQQRVFHSPMLRYYFDYFVALLTPAGMVPEFGDGSWAMNLTESVLMLERGAREYQDGRMKWAANRMLEHMGAIQPRATIGYEPGPALESSSVGLARMLIRRNEWGDATVRPEQPTRTSGDVLDEVIGKKIVMRSGWQANDTYVLLNYKDEGYWSLPQKNYLKQILAVEEEKMHHGHSDENSIALFMKEGAVLLSDGGYRPSAPSGPYGAWRADIFHNRVVVRDRRKAVGQPYLEFLRDAGAYNDAVETTKIDFQDFDGFEYARTRLRDQRTAYAADRIVVRDKEEDYLVVVDALKYSATRYYTAAALWHTRRVVESGPTWYRLRIDSLMGRFANPASMDLLVVMPQGHEHGSFTQNRAGQDESAVYQAVTQQFAAGDVQSFVSILVPLMPEDDASAIADRFKLVKDDTEAVTVEVDGATWYGVKLDLDRDLLTADIRPRYNYDSGRIDYGPFETDADFSFVTTKSGAPHYAATNFVRLDYGGSTLFDTPASQFFQVWGRSDHVGRAKWRRWDNFPDRQD